MKPLNQLTGQDFIEILKTVDRKTWCKVAAVTAAGLVLFVFLIWPAWFKRIQIRSQITGIKNQLTGLEFLSQQKPQLLKNQEEFKKFVAEAKKKLYQPGETSLLLGAISKLADESKVAILASRPKEMDENHKFPAPFDQAYEGELYEFTVEGGYHAIGQLISKIESNPKLLRVQLFDLNPQEDKFEVHKAEIVLSAVSQKKNSPAAAARPLAPGTTP